MKPQTRQALTWPRQLLDSAVFCTFFATGLLIVTFQYSEIVAMIGCGAYLTAMVGVFPERFRNRRGKLTTACGLLAFLWILTAVVGWLVWRGEIVS